VTVRDEGEIIAEEEEDISSDEENTRAETSTVEELKALFERNIRERFIYGLLDVRRVMICTR